jgi:two-component system, response regulator YesN
MKALPALLERGERDQFIMILTSSLDCLRNLACKSTAAEELYYTAATMLLSHINRRNLMEKLSSKLDMGILMRAEAHDGWSEAVDYLCSVSVAVFELQKGEQENNISESIDKIQQYIKEHLSEDLSLVRLAELSFFNPSYLSRLFKQATGQNLTDYISGLRIERAKEMLAEHGKISDISTALGYESQHYFSRFFKKYTGLTPQEFREFKRIM